MSKNKDYERSEISQLKDKIRALRAELGVRDRKIKNLKSELKTLNAALSKSAMYIDDRLSDVSIETVVDYFNDKTTGRIKDIEKVHKESQDALAKKWACHKCDEGFLRLVLIDRHDGKHYFRKCTHCDNRTNMQKYNSDVEGIL